MSIYFTPHIRLIIHFSTDTMTIHFLFSRTMSHFSMHAKIQRPRSQCRGNTTISRSPSYFAFFSGWNKYVGRGCTTNRGSGHRVEYMPMMYAALVKSTSTPPA